MYVVSTMEDLKSLNRGLFKFHSYRKGGEFEFNIETFSSEENRHLSALINRYNNECGCTAGGLTMGAGFMATVIYFITKGGKFSDLGLWEWMCLVGITFCSAVAGKLARLMWARWKMIKLTGDTLSKMKFKTHLLTIL